MSSAGKMLAWVEPGGEGQFAAAYVSAAAIPGSRPATRSCASYAEARQLVEALAASINFEIEWVTPPVVHGQHPAQVAVAE
jgi:hypothetical protein